MWHARLVRDGGGTGAGCCSEAASIRESLMGNVAVSGAESYLLEGLFLSVDSRCGEGLEIAAGAQESGVVKALPMQVMCKQRARRSGTEYVHVRIILILILALLVVRVDPPWLPLTGGLADNLEAVSHRRHGSHDCFGTGDSADLHVVGETNFLFGDGGDDKTARKQSWAWKGLGNSKDIDGNRTAVICPCRGVRIESNRPDKKGVETATKGPPTTPSFRHHTGACPLCQPASCSLQL